MAEFSNKFTELKKLFILKNEGGLKAFGSESARDALEFNDARLAQFGIISYALSKLVMKPYIVHTRQWKNFSRFLLQALSSGEKCKEGREGYESILTSILSNLEELSRDLGRSVVNAVEKGKVKAATQIYAHGASIGIAIELTGADRKSLVAYIGTTRLPEKYESKSVEDRLKYSDKLFT